MQIVFDAKDGVAAKKIIDAVEERDRGPSRYGVEALIAELEARGARVSRLGSVETLGTRVTIVMDLP